MNVSSMRNGKVNAQIIPLFFVFVFPFSHFGYFAFILFSSNCSLSYYTIGELEYRVTEESMKDRVNTNMREACLSIDASCRLVMLTSTKSAIVSYYLLTFFGEWELLKEMASIFDSQNSHPLLPK